MNNQIQYSQTNTQILDKTADCLKFCPFNEFKDFFLLAFYQLDDKETQTVVGGMEVYQLVNDQAVKVNKLESGGVLDFQWINQKINNKMYFLTAQCDSKVKLYEFNPSNKQMIIEVKSMDIEAENEIKCLYIDVVLKNDILYVITGTDQETVNILQISANDFELINTETIRKHEFSVWACAVCPQNPEFNYLSGGDDCHLKLLDLRMPNKIGMVNKQSHIQGITTINFSPHDANVFATGSYDEHLRMFDIRKINQELLDYKRAGGVWRARFDLNDKNKILCGIYSENYFELIDYSDPSQCNIVQTFKDHEKLAYSCDISIDSQYISTCSFYDKKLNLWKIKNE